MAVPAPQCGERKLAMGARQEVDRLSDLRGIHRPCERNVRHPAVRNTVSGDTGHPLKGAVHRSMKLKEGSADDAEARQHLPTTSLEENQAGSVDGQRQDFGERRQTVVILGRDPRCSQQGDVRAVRRSAVPALGGKARLLQNAPVPMNEMLRVHIKEELHAIHA